MPELRSPEVGSARARRGQEKSYFLIKLGIGKPFFLFGDFPDSETSRTGRALGGRP